MIVKELFEIVFVDRFDCENLLAQVRFKNIGLCEISKEKGNDAMELEYFAMTFYTTAWI